MENGKAKNPRVSRKRVQHFHAIRISHLRALGLLKPGEQTRHVFPSSVHSAYSCYLRPGAPYVCVIEYADILQIIGLVTRKVGRGQRYFFRDENGIVCEKLYPYKGHWASRQTAGLAYVSQTQSRLDRMIAKANQISHDVLGKRGKGPARGRSREKKLALLGVLKTELEGLSKIIERESKRPRRPKKEKVSDALVSVDQCGTKPGP